ncbi:MAG: alkaline phosphatase family protein [Tenacibaculum sp.]
MKKITLTLIGLVILFIGCKKNNSNTASKEAEDKSPKVFLISLDGVRWQEIFTGADSLLINSPVFNKDTALLKQKYWDKDFKIRRKKLNPFLWETLVKKGQLYGNRNLNNKVNVANSYWFSYPGYSEILTGFADDQKINSNKKYNNPNKTILELANSMPEFKGEVGAFASWDVFPYIINEERSGIYVNAGYREAVAENISDKELYLNQLQKQAIKPWRSVRQDVFTHHYALEFIKRKKPKLLYIAYGETDDFAHDGDYTNYLLSLENTNMMIQQLWAYCQSNEYYKNKTTFIITVDHGRGTQPIEAWKHHGQYNDDKGNTKRVEGSNQTWIAVLGPSIDAKGEVAEQMQLYNDQIVSTIKKILQITNDKGFENKQVLPFFE